MKYSVGTSGYQAPEVSSKVMVTQAIDMWSYGVILYELAVAYKPTGLKNCISNLEWPPFIESAWKKIDPNLKDLIRLCLMFKPEERITAREALKHAYFLA